MMKLKKNIYIKKKDPKKWLESTMLVNPPNPQLRTWNQNNFIESKSETIISLILNKSLKDEIEKKFN
jgi:hypothetical protein